MARGRSPGSGPGRSGLLRSASSAFALQTAGAGLNFLSQSALAKVLGAALFGQYTVAFTISQLIATPTDLGASSSVIRFAPQYRAQRKKAELRGLVLVAQLTPIALGSLVAAIFAAIVAVVGFGSAPTALLLVAVLSMPLFALSLVQMNLLRALGRILAAFGPILVLQPAIILSVVLLAPRAGVLTYGWATVAALAVVVAVQSWRLRSATSEFREPRSFDVRHWLSVSLPMLFINVVQLAFQRLDIVAVGLLLDAKSAGIYAIANRLAVATASLQKALVSVIAPQMSSLHYSGRGDEVERLVLRGLRLLVVPATLVTLALAAVGGPLLGWIGEPYRAGYLALVVYAAGQLFSVSSGPVGWLVAIIGEQRAMARVTVISALIAIVGYATLIPLLGIVGAAIGNSAGVVYRNVAATRIVRRNGIHISVLRAFRNRPELRDVDAG